MRSRWLTRRGMPRLTWMSIARASGVMSSVDRDQAGGVERCEHRRVAEHGDPARAAESSGGGRAVGVACAVPAREPGRRGGPHHGPGARREHVRSQRAAIGEDDREAIVVAEQGAGLDCAGPERVGAAGARAAVPPDDPALTVGRQQPAAVAGERDAGDAVLRGSRQCWQGPQRDLGRVCDQDAPRAASSERIRACTPPNTIGGASARAARGRGSRRSVPDPYQ